MKTSDIVLGQIEVTAENPEKNLSRALSVIKDTPEGKLIVFPEMMIPGYMIGDGWLRESYIRECKDMNQDILDGLKQAGNSAIWGNIDFDETKKNNDGSMRKYNAAYVGEQGTLLGQRYKTLLPNYRMFDDKRYFTSQAELAAEDGTPIKEIYKPFEIEISGIRRKVGVLICEDIWNIHEDYPLDPVALTQEYNPELLAVVSASPFGIEKEDFRHRLLQRQSTGNTLAYVNPIGSQNIEKTIHVFDGGSALYENGKFIHGIRDYTSDKVLQSLEKKTEIEQIYNALTYALKKFWEQTGKKKFIIGLSGGLDSAVVASLLVTAIGKENVIAVNMPSNFNTETTKNLAEKTAKNLDISYLVSPIQSIVDEEIRIIEETTGKSVNSFDRENIQARTRGIRLAGIAANQNALFTNNGNKDETATGYATLYGDVAGAISPIADLYKDLQVRPLARYINTLAEREIIPEKIIKMQPTAELSDAQNPESGGGDPFNYEFLGKINWATIEKKMTPEELLLSYKKGTLQQVLGLKNPIEYYFSTAKDFIEEIEKIWKLQKRAVLKRTQAPAVIQVSRGSFGFDYREALGNVHFTRNYETLKQEILSL